MKYTIIPCTVLTLCLFGAGCQAQPISQAKTIPGTAIVPLVAKIAEVTGTVTFQPKDGKAEDAKVGTEIKAGDTLSTGINGNVSLEFFSGSRTAIDHNSKLTIDEDSIDPNQWTKQRVRLTLESGRVWSRILKLLDASSTYEVTYNGITSSVRGTAYALNCLGTSYELDQFDGSTHLAGTSTIGDVPTGFTAEFQTDRPPANIATALSPTPDEVRDDFWIRYQLKADEDFANRAIDIRNQNGTDETAGTIGYEAGPFTLDLPNTQHSGFYHVKITTDGGTSVASGGSLQLHAFPEFNSPDGTTSSHAEVTGQATWQVSDSSLGSVDGDGVFHADATANGIETVIARWNDMTHEHSGSIQLVVGTSN